jgi:hypothetical protein
MKAGEAPFARIEQLIDQIFFNPAVPSQQIRHEQFRKIWFILKSGNHGHFGDESSIAVVVAMRSP